MQPTQCIILAGGLGTRLRSEVADLPKCMAPVAGKPFLHWVISYLSSQRITSFVFSLGYLHQVVIDYIAKEHPALAARFSVEKEPLGTGGAIKLAMQQCTDECILVVNGDTLFEADIAKLSAFHAAHQAACTLALKPMQHFDRYGAVLLNQQNKIISFQEKQLMEKGLINGGVYCIDRNKFLAMPLPDQFSFEKDYLEKYLQSQTLVGMEDDGYFIDIGIPSDFKKANADLKQKLHDTTTGSK